MPEEGVQVNVYRKSHSGVGSDWGQTELRPGSDHLRKRNKTQAEPKGV
jgi:hypothetical protein